MSASATARRRVVFFAPSPSENGGAQRRVRLLAGGLVDRGWIVLIVGRSVHRWWFSTYRIGSVRVLEIPGFGRQRLGALCFLLSAICIGVKNAARSHGFLALQLSSPAVAAALCGLLTRRPFLVLCSTSGSLSELSLVKQGPGAAIRRRLLRRAALLVGQTDEAVAELRSVFPGTSVAVLRNPVAPASAPPLSGMPCVAFAGRLSEEKDLLGLLSVWEELATERSEARLTLIGSGSAHRSVEDALRERVDQVSILRSTVRFTGWLSDPTTELVDADVFVFPSHSEGMSNALLEACALGRVVVASAIPANMAVLGSDYPLLFPAGDRAALLRSLKLALEDARVRTSCRALISERLRLFAPESISERLERFLLDAGSARHQ